ncbi:MAG TPA: hypothetical protein DCL76_01330 [Chloroflexi bacterium]|nr:hypothetical protein [Chloroflexota bacterium]|tara:strand:+ start:7874 stop:8824 length:951 start_codon:yes stop_codon:yes gene_type:complete
MDFPKYSSVEDILEDVVALRPKGGSAYGYCSAMAYKLIAEDNSLTTIDTLFDKLDSVTEVLLFEKPTMATIHNAKILIVDDVRKLISESDIDNIKISMIKRANLFIERSAIALDRLGQFGGNLIQDGQVIMIHSFSRSLMSCFASAVESGKSFEVICTESQPTKESRWAIDQFVAWGIRVSFVIDAGMAMIISEADWCLTGADSISYVGDVANKIGTYQLALLSQVFNKPFYVASEIMKLQTQTMEGYPIYLERRPDDEILDLQQFGDEIDTIDVRHQFFDLTPANCIRGIITERGMIPPVSIGNEWEKFRLSFND